MFAHLPLIVLSALGQVVHGWSMDASCTPISTELKAAMKLAFQRANDATEQIRMARQDVHVNALAKTLFGGDSAKIKDAGDRLWRIQFLDYFAAGRTGPSDVHVYCSTTRIKDWMEKGVKVGYTDPERGSVQGGTSMNSCRGIDHSGGKTRALMINAGGYISPKTGKKTVERHPDTLQLCKWYLAGLHLNGFAMSDELIKKAADKKSKGVVGKFIAKISGDKPAAPVDSIFDFASVLLHELTHSFMAGYSDNTPANKCYGWNACAKCQLS